MNETADPDKALSQLRAEMLNFILDELGARTADGRAPDLAVKLRGTVEALVDEVITSRLNRLEEREAETIARRTFELMKTEIVEQGDQRPPTNGPEPPHKLPPPTRKSRAYYTRLLLYLSPYLAMVLAIIAALAYLYWQAKADLTERNREYVQQSTSLGETCQVRLDISGQNSLLRDTRQWKEQCGPDAKEPHKNPLCVAQAKMQGWENRIDWCPQP